MENLRDIKIHHQKDIGAFCLLFILLFLRAFAPSLCGMAGGSGVPGLMLDTYGARGISLAGAFSGIADDISTISVNPAGLNSLRSAEVSMTYLDYPLGMSFGHFACGMKLPPSLLQGYTAISMQFFNLPDFDQYDAQGNKVDGSLSASDLILTLGYANNPLKSLGTKENFNLGINLKFIRTRLVEISRNAFGMDIGFLYRMSIFSFGRKKLMDNLGLGCSFQNLGTSLKFVSEDTPLPRNIRIGAGYTMFADNKASLLLGLEANIPNDSSAILNTGLEYSFREILSLRLGYRFCDEGADKISMGIGGAYPFPRFRLGFDYCFIPSGGTGTKHIVSLTLKFIHQPGTRDLAQKFTMDRREHEVFIMINEDQARLFEKERTEIRPEAYPVLDRVTDIINQEEYKRVIIMVHTDNKGTKEYQFYLSENRAKAIYDHLVQKGVDPKRTSFKGYGSVKPATGNGTSTGPMENFRSEIVVVRWKQGEEKEFKQFYFFGLDAFIKESYEEAIVNWKKALKLDPDNEELVKRVQEAEKRIKERKSTK